MPKFNRGDIITYNRHTATDIEDLLTPVGAEVEGVQEERLLITDVIYHTLAGEYHPVPSAYKLLWLNKGQDTQLSIAYADSKYKLVA